MALKRKETKNVDWVVAGRTEYGFIRGVSDGGMAVSVLMDIRDLLKRMDRRLLKLEKKAEGR